MPTWMDQYSQLSVEDWANLMASRGCKFDDEKGEENEDEEPTA